MVPTPDRSRRLSELMVATPEGAAAGNKRNASGRCVVLREGPNIVVGHWAMV